MAKKRGVSLFTIFINYTPSTFSFIYTGKQSKNPKRIHEYMSALADSLLDEVLKDFNAEHGF